ncbi:MAG: hypothetical protein CVU94_01940 [Firmicutes bacterium HGW-Firmicutes-19]|jgi:hypothetical protein|nr:MAG: hypothetical protein CVU94_01940 [Firmicutes bacterium HGW-Firmicutes-19]
MKLNDIQEFILKVMLEDGYYDNFEVLNKSFGHEDVDSSVDGLVTMGYVRIDNALCDYRKLSFLAKGRQFVAERF